MSASINDIAITIISNGETYSSYKGIGNILWEVDFGLYSNSKPKASKIFKFAKNTIWDDSIASLKSPLIKPVYGILTVDFDNKTIVDNNGYSAWDVMYLSWFINCIFKYAKREIKANGSMLLSEKTVEEQLKNGNFFIGNSSYKPVDLILPDNIQGVYELLVSFGDERSRTLTLIEKDYTWSQIKPPIGWTTRGE